MSQWKRNRSENVQGYSPHLFCWNKLRTVEKMVAPLIASRTTSRTLRAITYNTNTTCTPTWTGKRALVRHSSHSPLSSASTSRKKVTLPSIMSMYRKNDPITMITAHDFPSAHVADQAGMDMILVGDSLAMVALGMEDTSEVLMEEMLLHCRSVSRGSRAAFTVRQTSHSLGPVRSLLTTPPRSVIFQWVHTKFLPNKPFNPRFAS